MINMPGGPEMMVIVLLALIVLGPKELPKVMRTVGNVMAEVRKVSSGFQNEMRSAMDSLTDDNPSKASEPKPQSGTMTAIAVPEPANDEGGEASPGDQEIVARNPETRIAPPVAEPTAGDGAPTGSVTGPAVDPADRAAG